KRRKLNEEAQEVKDLKRHLEVVNDEDDDVFTEASLLARKTMFEKPDGQDAVWKSQRSVHGLALIKRYPLSKFTLEQLVNVTRLQVEEESEMSLELLRFTRQQLQEYQQG
nr:hypothetical protein [Tanacetum cinerariifolium]